MLLNISQLIRWTLKRNNNNYIKKHINECICRIKYYFVSHFKIGPFGRLYEMEIKMDCIWHFDQSTYCSILYLSPFLPMNTMILFARACSYIFSKGVFFFSTLPHENDSYIDMYELCAALKRERRKQRPRASSLRGRAYKSPSDSFSDVSTSNPIQKIEQQYIGLYRSAFSFGIYIQAHCRQIAKFYVIKQFA